MTSNEALKPCAHCGSRDVEMRETITDACIACNNCGCRTGFVYFGASEAANASKKRELASVWNTRSTDTPVCASTEGLVEHWKKGCNRYTNGQCQSRSCLVRGGYEGGPPDYSLATCEEHETVLALAASQAPERLREALLNMVGQVEQAKDGFGIWPYANSCSMKTALAEARAVLSSKPLIMPLEGKE